MSEQMVEQSQAAPPEQEREHTQSEPSPDKKQPTPNRRARTLGLRIAVVLAIGIAAFVAWREFFMKPSAAPNVVAVSGRIEGDDSAIAPKTAGRILEIRTREGDQVRAGDIIAVLDDAQIRAREDQARAAVTQAEARLRSAQQQIGILEEEFKQTGIQTEQAKQQADGTVRQSEAELAASEAELARQEAAYRLAEFDREAYTSLARTGTVSERRGREAESNAAAQAATVAAAKRQVEAARGALTAARTNLTNPQIRLSQMAAIRQQLAQQNTTIASTFAEATQARAQLAEAQANRADLIVRAPFDGTVATRAAEPGEVVTAGTAIITLVDLGRVYLRGFVPEGDIGKVRVNQPARVYLDSNPQRPIDAYVSRIDPQASFTPENTYFRNDRVRQVVGVKLQLKGAIGYAKPGMPADGEILIAEVPGSRRASQGSGRP